MPSKVVGVSGEPKRSIVGGEPVKKKSEKESTSANN